MKKTTKQAVFTGLLAVLFGFSTHAAITYNNTFTDAGAIAQGGSVFSAQHSFTGLGGPITSVQIILTFNDASSLTGNSSGIQGLLTLGTLTTSPSVGFYPTATSTSGAQRIYTLTTSGLNGFDPNTTWGLVLWDNGTSGIENSLVGWSLNVTVVPEPITYALASFGFVIAGVGATRFYLRRKKVSAGV